MDITDNLTSKVFSEIPDSWSLANDAILSKLLQRLSEKLTLKTHDVQTALEKLQNSLHDVSVEVCNMNNDLFVLSHKQFMENRTYISGNVCQASYSSSTTRVSMPKANETGIFTACKSALRTGVLQSNSSISGEGVQCVNTFTSRILPPIIGSDEFLLQNNYCSPSEKLARKNYSRQSLEMNQSVPVAALSSTAPMSTSVTPPPLISDISPVGQAPISTASSSLNDQDLESEAIQENRNYDVDAKSPLNKGIPVLPLPIEPVPNHREELTRNLEDITASSISASVISSKTALSVKKSDLFDSDSDSDDLFTPALRSLPKPNILDKSGSNDFDKIQDIPAKKIPAGGISIFPPSVTNPVQNNIDSTPPRINLKPSKVKPETGRANSELPAGKDASNKFNQPLEDSDTELFVPVAEKVHSVVGKSPKGPFLSGSSDEETMAPFLTANLTQPVKKHVPTKRKSTFSSKHKSIWSSDDSDSDPFSCTLATTPPKPKATNIGNPVKKMVTPENKMHIKSDRISSIIQNDCDIFSNDTDINSTDNSERIVPELLQNKSDVKLPSDIFTHDESDEDIFSESSKLAASTRTDYSRHISAVDTSIPDFPTRQLSDSDDSDCIFRHNDNSPPPINQVMVPVFDSLSPALRGSPELARHSTSLADSPPPMYDSALPSFARAEPCRKNVQPKPSEPCNVRVSQRDKASTASHKAPVQLSKVDATNSSGAAILASDTKPSPGRTKHFDSLISSLESKLSRSSVKDAVCVSNDSTGGQLGVTGRVRDNTEEPVCFNSPLAPPELASLQKTRPKIQYKRRPPTKKTHTGEGKDTGTIFDALQDSTDSLPRGRSPHSTGSNSNSSSNSNPNPAKPGGGPSLNQKYPPVSVIESSQATAATSSIAKTILFAGSGSEDDLFSSKSGSKKSSYGPNSSKTNKGKCATEITNSNRSTSSSINKKAVTSSSYVPNSRDKQGITDGLNINTIKLPKNSGHECDSQPSDVDVPSMVKKNIKKKIPNLFDSSSDDDYIFGSTGKSTCQTNLKGSIQSLDRKRKETKEIDITDSITITAPGNLPVPDILNPLAAEEKQTRGITKTPQSNVLPTGDINASGKSSKSCDIPQSRGENKSKKFNLFVDDDSSDDQDLFEYNKKKEGSPTDDKPPYILPRGTVSEQKKSIVNNPLFSSQHDKSVEKSVNAKEREDILKRSNELKPDNSLIGSEPLDSKNIAKSTYKASSLSSGVKEHTPKTPNLFGTDESDDDGIFSSNSSLLVKQNSSLQSSIAVTNKLSDIIPSDRSSLAQSQAKLSGLPYSDSVAANQAGLPGRNFPNENKHLPKSDKTGDLPNSVENRDHIAAMGKDLAQKKDNGKALSTNDLSSDSDDLFTQSSKNVASNSRKPPKIVPNKTNITTEIVTPSPTVQKVGQKLKRGSSSESDGDGLFSQTDQTAKTKSVPSKRRNIFPSSDEDDDLFKPAK